MPETVFAAHRRLVDIHLFNDGNRRTARLLMNLVFIRGGYLPVSVRPVDRPSCIAALQEAQAGGGGMRLVFCCINVWTRHWMKPLAPFVRRFREIVGSGESGGHSVARGPPNRAYPCLRSDSECLMIVIGTCDMTR
jgi:fido (protein-threonine AMPylation protein)